MELNVVVPTEFKFSFGNQFEVFSRNYDRPFPFLVSPFIACRCAAEVLFRYSLSMSRTGH
jgi:hypothetical protein